MNTEIKTLASSLDKAVRLVLTRLRLGDTNLSKRVEVSITNEEVLILFPDYAQYIDKGRRVGKMPPVSSIYDWIREKKIRPPKGLRQLDLAWAVARSIERKGVKPRPFLDVFQEQIADLLMKHLDSKIDNILKEKK